MFRKLLAITSKATLKLTKAMKKSFVGVRISNVNNVGRNVINSVTTKAIG